MVRGRRTLPRLDPLRCRYIIQQSVFRVVDELALLPLFDILDGQPELLSDLTVRITTEIGNARVDIQHCGNGAERVLARLFLIVHKRLWYSLFVFGAASDLDRSVIHDAIDPERAGLQRLPVQEPHESPRSNRRILRRRLRDISRLKCCAITQRMSRWFGHSQISP